MRQGHLIQTVCRNIHGCEDVARGPDGRRAFFAQQRGDKNWAVHVDRVAMHMSDVRPRTVVFELDGCHALNDLTLALRIPPVYSSVLQYIGSVTLTLYMSGRPWEFEKWQCTDMEELIHVMATLHGRQIRRENDVLFVPLALFGTQPHDLLPIITDPRPTVSVTFHTGVDIDALAPSLSAVKYTGNVRGPMWTGSEPHLYSMCSSQVQYEEHSLQPDAPRIRLNVNAHVTHIAFWGPGVYKLRSVQLLINDHVVIDRTVEELEYDFKERHAGNPAGRRWAVHMLDFRNDTTPDICSAPLFSRVERAHLRLDFGGDTGGRGLVHVMAVSYNFMEITPSCIGVRWVL